MFMLCRRYSQLNNLYLLVSFLLAAGFLFEMKVLYHGHQRSVRLADYDSRLNDLSDNVKSIMRIANVTSSVTSDLSQRLMHSSLRKKRLHNKDKMS